MDKNRDGLGRFTTGNTIAALGWQGLVQRRFQGNELAAREWLGRIGVWAYAKQFAGNQTAMMQMRAATVYAHPGPPEQFVQRYRQRFEFTLADVQERSF